MLAGRPLAHLVQDALFGGDDQAPRIQCPRGLDQLGGGADHVGLRQYRRRRFGMRQHARIGVLGAHQRQLGALEFVVHQACALPQQHVGAGLLLHIVAQVPVGRPQDLLAARMQVGDQVQRDRRGDDPIGARFHRGAGVGVDHHGTVGMRVAPGREVRRGTAQVERATGREIRHQHALAGAEDLGGVAHEAHARHDQCPGGVVAAETGHFQRVADAAAGGFGQFLDVGIDVVMRHHHGVLAGQQRTDAACRLGAFGGGKGAGTRVQAWPTMPGWPAPGRSNSTKCVGSAVMAKVHSV